MGGYLSIAQATPETDTARRENIQNIPAGPEQRISFFGLDGAGKTFILYKLKWGLQEKISTKRTVGFNSENFQYKERQFSVADIGGIAKIRDIWRHFFQGTIGIIYVIDSADRERFEEAKKELHSILRSEHLTRIPLLVLANKQDLPDALSPSEISEKLDLDNVYSPDDRQWHVQGCSAIKNGQGLVEGMEWLADQVFTPARE